jgi:hypothetical protein
MNFFRKFYIFAWLVAAALYVRAGFAPDWYVIHNNLPVPLYPTKFILVCLLVSAAECAILTFIVRPWSFHRSWGRLLVALAVFVPWAILSLLSLMHAAPVVVAHALWLLLVVAGLCVAAVITVFRRNAA